MLSKNVRFGVYTVCSQFPDPVLVRAFDRKEDAIIHLAAFGYLFEQKCQYVEWQMDENGADRIGVTTRDFLTQNWRTLQVCEYPR